MSDSGTPAQLNMTDHPDPSAPVMSDQRRKRPRAKKIITDITIDGPGPHDTTICRHHPEGAGMASTFSVPSAAVEEGPPARVVGVELVRQLHQGISIVDFDGRQFSVPTEALLGMPNQEPQ
jgi:hypothetical protein